MPRLTDRVLDNLLVDSKRAFLDRIRARLLSTSSARSIRRRAEALSRRADAYYAKGASLRQAKAALIADAERTGLVLSFSFCSDERGSTFDLDPATGNNGYYDRRNGWPDAAIAERAAFDALYRRVQAARAGGDRAQLQAAIEALSALVEGKNGTV